MKGLHLFLRLAWRGTAGALAGASLCFFGATLAYGSYSPSPARIIPYFLLFLFFTAPVVLAVGLAVASTVWLIGRRKGGRVGALLRAGVGVGYATAASLVLLRLMGEGAGPAVCLGFLIGAGAGLFAEGGGAGGDAELR